MRRTVIRATLAEGLVCIETGACTRRRYRGRQLALLGADDGARLEPD